jgi:hypothetical protein
MAPKIRQIVPTGTPAARREAVAFDELALGDHLEKYLVAKDNKSKVFVYHGMLGSPHVYVYPPSKELKRAWYTLVTMGASGTVMPVPAGISNPERYQRTEFMCYLPESWKLPTTLPSTNEEESWPIDMMRDLVGYVVNAGVWVSFDHGLPNLAAFGQPYCRTTKLCSCVTLEPLGEAEGFSPYVSTPEDNKGKQEFVNFLLCVPLTAAEAQWKRDVGIVKSLYYVVGDSTVNPAIPIPYIIDPSRKCAVVDLDCPNQIPSDEEGDAEAEEGSANAAGDQDGTKKQ